MWSGRLTDATGLVPHSEAWFAYYEDQFGRLVDGENVRQEKSRQGFESGGRWKRASFASGFNGIRPLVANLLAGYIGHGRSLVWLQLKMFLNDRLNLESDEFNSEAVAGISTTERIQKML